MAYWWPLLQMSLSITVVSRDINALINDLNWFKKVASWSVILYRALGRRRILSEG